MNTSPNDQRGLFHDARAAAAREAVAGELLFEFLRGHDRFRVELRDHGRYGIEAQFLRNEEFYYSRRFEDLTGNINAKALAMAWAESERTALLAGAER